MSPSVPSAGPPDDRSFPSRHQPGPEYTLHGIAAQLLKTGSLTAEQLAYLRRTSERPVPFMERIGSHFGGVAKIAALSAAILAHKMGLQDAAKQMTHLSDRQGSVLSASEEKAFATLLLSYEHAVSHPLIIEESERLVGQKGSLDRSEVKALVDRHNMVSLPQPQRAGTLAFDIQGHKIYHNREGRLMLGTPDRKIVEPIALSAGKRSMAQVEQMKSIYHEVVDHAPYNNLGAMLDFMRFFRECRIVNPTLTLREAFLAFQPNPSEVYDKYHAGDCVVLTGAIQARLQKAGFETAAIGAYTGAPWARPPPNLGTRGINWQEYDDCTENVHHCSIASRFLNEVGKEAGILFDFFSEIGDPVTEGSWQEVERRAICAPKDTKGSIPNVDHILKMQMRGKTKMVLAGKNNSLFGIDLLQGNLYLNLEAIKGLNGLPLNGKGRFSINLHNLQTPDAIGTYVVDGRSVGMTHREALELAIRMAGDRFEFPSDFVDNVLTLAECLDPLFQDILLPPSAVVRDTLMEIDAAKNTVTEIERRSTLYRSQWSALPETTHALIREHETVRDRMLTHYTALQEAILAGQPEEIRRISALIVSQEKGLKGVVEEIEKQPELVA